MQPYEVQTMKCWAHVMGYFSFPVDDTNTRLFPRRICRWSAVADHLNLGLPICKMGMVTTAFSF